MNWERPDRTTATAMIAAALMLAQMMAAKAVRDAIFLSNFPVTDRPTMIIAAALFAIAASIGGSKLLRASSPDRFVPASFIVSAILQVGEWLLLGIHPRIAACLIFLHVFGLNVMLTSSFWSLMSEHYDPRSAKRAFGRIAGIGTCGGLLGGLLAERVAAWGAVNDEILLTALLHFACGAVLYRFAAHSHARTSSLLTVPVPARRVREVLRKSPYLLEITGLIVVISIAAALVDYLFQSQAVSAIAKGPSLTRFFALFYTVTSMTGVVLQAIVVPVMLSRLGLATTVSVLPVTVAAGGSLAIFLPGFNGITLLRALEVILRGSLFRSSYELFYTPVPAEDKRSVKTVIDVGAERLGDAMGNGLVALFLALQIGGKASILCTSVVFAMGGMILARRLGRSYIGALETSLAKQSASWRKEKEDEALDSLIISMPELGALPTDVESQAAAVPKDDPVLRHLLELRSGDEQRILGTLAKLQTPDPLLCHQLIRLLEYDSLAFLALDRLRRAAPLIVGQLTDALLNMDEEFAVRRRIPLILARSQSQRAIDGLLLALTDAPFEIRFRSAHALDQLRQDTPALTLNQERVWAIISQELQVSREVWHRRSLWEAPGTEDSADPAAVPGDASLEYLFALLALVLPREPVAMVYNALHTENRQLRGTALEYLQTVLPGNAWKLLEGLIADRLEVKAPG